MTFRGLRCGYFSFCVYFVCRYHVGSGAKKSADHSKTATAKRKEKCMAQEVLAPATQAEAEMAATARGLLVAALDHSTAKRIKLTIEGGEGDAPVLEVPPRALRFFAAVLRQMALREPLVVVPQSAQMTTQQAASFLNVSRPFVVKEIEAGRIKCHMVNTHRRIDFEELQRYQTEQKERSGAALRRMHELDAQIGEEP
ncbi:excisionase family DNA-binding protein [Variovorax sp. DT-64]|uniref:excisionase family DNA-binding protein n=1 Tax=Variovorax sp. DT-64 TaxID=3396160 RepID=UPI003F1AFF2F